MNPLVLCFRKCLVAKKFLDEREGELSRFPPEIFCLTVPKHFVEEPFYAVFQKISGSEKFNRCEGGGGVSNLSVENFFSHSTETFPRRILLCCVLENFW